MFDELLTLRRKLTKLQDSCRNWTKDVSQSRTVLFAIAFSQISSANDSSWNFAWFCKAMKQPFNPTWRIGRQMKRHNRTSVWLNLPFGFVNSEGTYFNWLIRSVHRSYYSDYGLFLYAADRDTVHDEYQIFFHRCCCRCDDDEVVLRPPWPAVLVETKPNIEGRTRTRIGHRIAITRFVGIQRTNRSLFGLGWTNRQVYGSKEEKPSWRYWNRSSGTFQDKKSLWIRYTPHLPPSISSNQFRSSK